MSHETRSAQPTQSRSGAPWRYRGDIEGLRGVAVLLVLAFHAGVPGLAGGYVGVDVFFVISGYLITGLLWRELSRENRISLAGFYARRVRRLLPAAGLVLVVTALAVFLTLPFLDWDRSGWDIMSAGTYVSNFRFAFDSTDYLAADLAPSAVLQYWSLSVEEQFYLVWPLALIGLWSIARRVPTARLRIMTLGLGGIAVASLVSSIILTTAAQPWAFFMMPTRAWEFALGGLVALWAVSGRSLPRGLAAPLGWVGLAAVVAAGMFFSVSTVFPGTAALLPVLGAAALILAGTVTVSGGVAGALRWRGLTATGRVSYSWYLWHWPFLVLGGALLGTDLSLWQSCGLVAASWLPAYLTYRYVETPIRLQNSRTATGRLSSRGGAWALGAAITVVVIAAGALLLVWPEKSGPALPVAQSAVSTATDPEPAQAGELTPRIGDARADIPKSYADGCHLQVLDQASVDCAYGNKGATTRVMLLGDSHAAQWLPALREIGDQQDWLVLNRTKSSCPVGGSQSQLEAPFNRPYTECDQWLHSIATELEQTPVDLVIVSGYQPRFGGPASQDPEAWRSALNQDLVNIKSRAGAVVVIGDTPYLAQDVPACLAKHSDSVEECASRRTDVLANGADRAAAELSGLPYLDMTDGICGATYCEAVRFGRVVWRDAHHITASYAAALGPALQSQLQQAAPDVVPTQP